ncbi:hypothetical protein M0802_002747 [Mischocyttarus mexicanus]|nr:hypothetical protein M0802_002747 [Mischocyttarus mexicanus]
MASMKLSASSKCVKYLMFIFNLAFVFKCCGVTNSSDWSVKIPNHELPVSCCSRQVGMIGSSTCNQTVPNVYKQGCLNTFQQYIKSHAVQLGGVGLGIATIQAVGIWFSIYLARSIRNSYESV